MLNAGFVNLGDSAWHDGLTEWQPLHQVLKLSPAPPQPPLPLNDQRAHREPINVKKDVPVAPQSTSMEHQTAPATSWQSDLTCALRWLLFIPGGLLIGAALSVPVCLFLEYMLADSLFSLASRKLSEYISGCIGSAFGGMIIVVVGCWIAPSTHKAFPAKIIGAFTILLFVLGFLYYAINGNWRFMVQSLVCVVAVFNSVRSIVRDSGRVSS